MNEFLLNRCHATFFIGKKKHTHIFIKRNIEYFQKAIKLMEYENDQSYEHIEFADRRNV